jgi:hypothetical protein
MKIPPSTWLRLQHTVFNIVAKLTMGTFNLLEHLGRVLAVDSLERRQSQRFQSHHKSTPNERVLKALTQSYNAQSYAYKVLISAPILSSEAHMRHSLNPLNPMSLCRERSYPMARR